MSGSLDWLITTHLPEFVSFLETGELDDQLMNRAYDIAVNSGEMPYGTAKARDGDPAQWMFDYVEMFLRAAK